MITVTNSEEVCRLRQGKIREIVLHVLSGTKTTTADNTSIQVVVVEEGDDLGKLPLPGEGGLLGYIDDEFQGFDDVWHEVDEAGSLLYVAVIVRNDSMTAVVIPSEKWLPAIVQDVLHAESLAHCEN